MLLSLRERRVAAHVEIAEYILGRAKDSDPGTRAVFEVIADDILQHKAML